MKILQTIKFETDYQEGCHPKILERLIQTNLEQTSGYGADTHTENARALIKNVIAKPNAKVFFMVGGTQTNTTLIKYLLTPCEGVISASTGHINVHESGAIEATGHKILALPGHDGLLEPETLRSYLERFYADPTNDHMVQPGMVYISYSSEYGTLYTKKMLAELREICNSYDFPEPAKFNLKNFTTLIKQQGGLLAKGRLLGLQFEALFEDNLYFQNAQHSNVQAMKIKQAFTEKGIKFLIDSPTNQQFPILTREQNEKLAAKFSYELWEPLEDDKLAVRFCTSWATSDENVEELIRAIKIL